MSRGQHALGLISLFFASQFSWAVPVSIDCGDLDMNICRRFLDHTEATRESLDFEQSFRLVVLAHNEFPSVPLRIMHDSRGFFTPIYAGASNAEVWNLAHYVNLRMRWDPVFMPHEGMLAFGPGVGLYQANRVLLSMLRWFEQSNPDHSANFSRRRRLFLSSYYFGSSRMTSLGELSEAIFPVFPEVNSMGRVTNFAQLENSGVLIGRHLRIPADEVDTFDEVSFVFNLLNSMTAVRKNDGLTLDCHASEVSDCLDRYLRLWSCFDHGALKNRGVSRVILSSSVRDLRRGAGILAWPMQSRGACRRSGAAEHADFFSALREQFQVEPYL